MPDIDIEQDEQDQQPDPVESFMRGAGRGGFDQNDAGWGSVFRNVAAMPRSVRSLMMKGGSSSVGNDDNQIDPATLRPRVPRSSAALDDSSTSAATPAPSPAPAGPAMGRAYGPPSPEDLTPPVSTTDDAAKSLGEFAAASGMGVTPPPPKPAPAAPKIPTLSPDYKLTQEDLRAHSAVTPKYDPVTGKTLDRYHEGVGGRIGRAFLDATEGFATGGIGGAAYRTLEGGFGNKNAPGFFGKGAVNDQWGKDENARRQQVAADTAKIGSFEDEQRQNQQTFNDEYKLQHDQELSEARQENADTRRDLAQARENAIDRNSVFKGQDGSYYGYAFGDTERKNPIKVTPSQQITAQNRPAQTPKTYEQQVLAWAQETDPQKKAELEKSIQRIEQQRRSLHTRANQRIPDVNGLSVDQNRAFRAQLTAEAIPQRRAALQRSLTLAAPKDQSGIQSAINELDQRSQQILADIRKRPGNSNSAPKYTRYANDGKGNRVGYNPSTKQWERVKGSR